MPPVMCMRQCHALFAVQACGAAAGPSTGVPSPGSRTVHVLFTSNGTPYMNRQVR